MHTLGRGDLWSSMVEREESAAQDYESALADAVDTLVRGGQLPDGPGFAEMCEPWDSEPSLSTLVGELMAFNTDTLRKEWEARAWKLAREWLNETRAAA